MTWYVQYLRARDIADQRIREAEANRIASSGHAAAGRRGLVAAIVGRVKAATRGADARRFVRDCAEEARRQNLVQQVGPIHHS